MVARRQTTGCSALSQWSVGASLLVNACFTLLGPLSAKHSLFNFPRMQVFQDPLCEEAMRAAGVQAADAVVLGLPARASFPCADAQLLSALFQVQSLAAEAEHRVHVVAKVG